MIRSILGVIWQIKSVTEIITCAIYYPADDIRHEDLPRYMLDSLHLSISFFLADFIICSVLS
jgi:hypothetical protein